MKKQVEQEAAVIGAYVKLEEAVHDWMAWKAMTSMGQLDGPETDLFFALSELQQAKRAAE